MKLLDTKYHYMIQFPENEVQVLVLERPDVYSDYLQRLYGQCQGQDMGLILSEKEKMLSLEKCAELILNPIGISFQNRRITASLLHELGQVMEEEFLQESLLLKSQILEFVNSLCEKLPYDLECALDMNLIDVVKAADVKIDIEGKSLCERLIQYLKINSLLCRTNLLVFVNLKNFLAPDEILVLYQTAFYYKINLLLVESTVGKQLEGECYHVVDKDLCIVDF